MAKSQPCPGRDPRGRPIWIPIVDAGDSALDVALKYAEAGWRVVPTERDSPNENSVVNDAMKNASRDPQQIAEWFLGNDFAIIAVCDVAETYVANPNAIPSATQVFDAEAVIARGGVPQ